MQIIDLAEQTRLLGQVAPTLQSLRQEVESVRAGEISKPLREIGPIAIRAQGLAMQCTQQVAVLSTSQYAAMKDGHENLAELVEASTQISLAATLCTFAIHRRTEVLLYEGADDASGNPLLGQAFLHRSRVPLSVAPIDHVTRSERDAAELDELENGVVNGCSPWACRGEEPEQDDFGLAS
ncbi:hypothetical protein ACFWTC_31710 [Streptomyces sp. NPDC058619]|uniref:hypothetical protein n=1 Tax=unclassified Streptomyces TaxID=2593676 RepID=UPI003658202C